MVSILVVIKPFVFLRLASFSTERKRCEGDGGVKPDGVISSLGTRQTASSKRHFYVLSLVLQSSSSCSSPHFSDELTTFNLRRSAVGHSNPFCFRKFCFAYWRRLASHLNIILSSRPARASLTMVNCNYVDTRPLLYTSCTSS